MSGFARREAAREGERAGAPVVGHRALRLQRAGGWRGEGGQRRGWRHRLEVGSCGGFSLVRSSGTLAAPAKSHLWAVTGVAVKLATGWIWCF